MAKKKTEMEEMEFEDAMQELEKVVEILENRQTRLKDAVVSFEKGRELARICEKRLEEAENAIRQVTAKELENFESLDPQEI